MVCSKFLEPDPIKSEEEVEQPTAKKQKQSQAIEGIIYGPDYPMSVSDGLKIKKFEGLGIEKAITKAGFKSDKNALHNYNLIKMFFK